MNENEEIRKRAAMRLDIVQGFLMRYSDAAMFAALYNAGDINRQLLEETGPVTADEISKWADICTEVGQ